MSQVVQRSGKGNRIWCSSTYSSSSDDTSRNWRDPSRPLCRGAGGDHATICGQRPKSRRNPPLMPTRGFHRGRCAGSIARPTGAGSQAPSRSSRAWQGKSTAIRNRYRSLSRPVSRSAARRVGDSLEFEIQGFRCGLGSPVYGKSIGSACSLTSSRFFRRECWKMLPSSMPLWLAPSPPPPPRIFSAPSWSAFQRLRDRFDPGPQYSRFFTRQSFRRNSRRRSFYHPDGLRRACQRRPQQPDPAGWRVFC